MNTTTHTEPVVLTEPAVLLDPEQVEQLRHLLGTVEDWLLHCGDDALDDLGGFLAGLGWAPHNTPQRLAANLVHDLGEQAMVLRAALRRSTQRDQPLRDQPLRDQPLRVEVDHGSTSAKGRRPGQVWLVKLRRGNRAVIITTGLARACAEHLAAQINPLLHPSSSDRAGTQTGRPA